ncbi:tetratricopeptide repeat protein [Adhaeretor mobilis]|uniref:Tetratricopeptide repeat protein n=1 Tax=Adhaeretor mobilis TaxID=1930276 RepID=A0A517MTY1_9BACT|nr:tetratricopeptide repeat protein [Adhaeretor mobilis]QDS98336.1 tetratricopeptide repeat protein [Adhaeretor mobilis]
MSTAVPSAESAAPEKIGSSSPEEAPRRAWIISPAWDLAYLVATPLVIVPAVLLVVRNWVSPEKVALTVISFASLGHHLPGFMRAYGDRELFARFRWRFLLAPPLLFLLALLFSPPAWLAQRLDLPWGHLHGLELILLVWGTWHGLMQTYGFMRIYDVKLGETKPREARLDHALCLVMFIAGVVFSDSRVFGIATAMWQAGLPVFGPEWLTTVRWTVGLAGTVVGLLYVVNLFVRWREGRPVNGVKLLLALSTGWFYWYTGRLSTNLLIGLAMFEIYHAVQYFAIVWIYNRRLFERAGERFGWLGFLFRDRASMLGIYLALIAAYSSIRYFTGDASSYIFTSGGNDAYQWLFALFVTSSLLHFYFDGFIWKVSDRRTQQNLVDSQSSASRLELSVPAMKHTAKWAVFAVLACGLLLSERKLLSGETGKREAEIREGLAELTPDLPEVQLLRSRAELLAGNKVEAVRLARAAVRLRPNAANIHLNAAAVLMGSGDLEAARELLEPLVAKNSKEFQPAADLAFVYDRQGNPEKADAMYREAIRRQPSLAEPRQQLVEFLRRHDRPIEALKEMQRVAQLLPKDYQTALALGDVLKATGEFDTAEQEFLRAASLKPNSSEPYYQLGLLHLSQQALPQATLAFEQAIALKPKRFDAQRLLGECYYEQQAWPAAIETFKECLRLRPELEENYINLASAHDQNGNLTAARAVLQAGIKRLPDAQQLQRAIELLAE